MLFLLTEDKAQQIKINYLNQGIVSIVREIILTMQAVIPAKLHCGFKQSVLDQGCIKRIPVWAKTQLKWLINRLELSNGTAIFL